MFKLPRVICSSSCQIRCIDTSVHVLGRVNNDGADKVPAAGLDGGFSCTVFVGCR